MVIYSPKMLRSRDGSRQCHGMSCHEMPRGTGRPKIRRSGNQGLVLPPALASLVRRILVFDYWSWAGLLSRGADGIMWRGASQSGSGNEPPSHRGQRAIPAETGSKMTLLIITSGAVQYRQLQIPSRCTFPPGSGQGRETPPWHPCRMFLDL